MESIKINFLEPYPDGLRRLTNTSWAGACLILSRGKLEAALKTGALRHPGIYILAGPSHTKKSRDGRQIIHEIYIGKTGSFDERLSQHAAFKNFWSTAFLFYHSGADEFEEGQTSDLEARLISKAKAAGNNIVSDNRALPESRPSEATEFFLAQIEDFLKALGYDFFSPQKISKNAVVEPLEAVNEPDSLGVHENLRPIVDQIREACLALPSTKFYPTRVPDLRAKIELEQGTRVYARIQFLKQAVKLSLHGETLHLPGAAVLDEGVKQKITQAYLYAKQKLLA